MSIAVPQLLAYHRVALRSRVVVSTSASVQKRSSSPRNMTSGLPQTTDIIRPARLVRFVPQPDSCTAAMTKRCPHSGRPAAYRARVVISSQSFGPEPRRRVPGRRLPCRGFKQRPTSLPGNERRSVVRSFSPSSQISISVPNSTTCLAGTPKKVAEPLALCCRNAKKVSRHTAMPTVLSLGMIVSRPT
jgi:hypothetical protein